jgi:hypothetical protein
MFSSYTRKYHHPEYSYRLMRRLQPVAVAAAISEQQ